MTTTTAEKKARTALTGSSYRRTGYNRYEVISRRILGIKARIMRDRGFIGECADRGGPASVFQTITGHHRILGISATTGRQRQQQAVKPEWLLSIDSPAQYARKSIFVWIADASTNSRDLNHVAKNCQIIDIPESPSMLNDVKSATGS